MQNWLLSTLSVNNVISESLSVQDRIQIETIPDNRFLSVIIDAMKKNLKIEIQYRRFGSEELKTHIFSPYALKVYQKRWYILAYFDPYTMAAGQKRKAHFTIFSFDYSLIYATGEHGAHTVTKISWQSNILTFTIREAKNERLLTKNHKKNL